MSGNGHDFNNIETRAVIKFFFPPARQGKEIRAILTETLVGTSWQHSGSPHTRKFWVQKSAGKFLASIFWDQDSILLIDYLPKGPNYQRGVLLISAGTTEGHFEGKTPR